MIYLDYAASTPVDPRVAEKMWSWLSQKNCCGNPSSSHSFGRKAKEAIEQARQQIAELINANSEEIVWTSGATEANNLAIRGIAYGYRSKGQHIITTQIEHEAVIEPCKQLEREGFSVTYLKPEKNGLINLENLAAALRPDTILVSIMHVNNETGFTQDITVLGKLLRNKNILFHVDAAQSAGKIAINIAQTPIDLMSFSAHKIYGPKGIGCLYINHKSKINFAAQILGGGQERGLRSGTLPTHQIIGMGEAFAIAKQEMSIEIPKICALRDKLWTEIKLLGNTYWNCDQQHCVASILNVSFKGIDSALLLPALRDLAISTGSACHSAKSAPSRVLRAMDLSDALAQNSIRFSFGRFTTKEEVDFAIAKIKQAVENLSGPHVSTQ